MTRSFVFSQDGIILNACCLRNLGASGYIRAILDAFPSPVMVAHFVYEQEQPLRMYQVTRGREREVTHMDLQPVFDAGSLSVAFLASEREEAAMIELAAVCGDDGEAMTAALARHRNWAMGVDGPGFTALLRRHLPDLPLLSTSFFLQQWVESSHPPSHALRTALRNMEERTNYRPPEQDALSLKWLEGSLGEDDAM